MIAFRYYGGKQRQLKWLLPLLPKCDHYIEPFCGAASVLLNREVSPLETINDTNEDIVIFFKVLRDRGDELIRKLELTPYARAEFVESLNHADDDLERARRFYVRVQQGFSGLTEKLTEGRWGYAKKIGSRSKVVVNAVDKLYAVANRIRLVQIEKRPALDVLRRFDHEKVLFYCDPPYLTIRDKISGYGVNDMTVTDHSQLAGALHNCKARVAISGHRCDLYDDLYRNWHRHDKEVNYIFFNNREGTPRNNRAESLWTNYEVPNP